MGLDLDCNGINVRVGSYSTYHTLKSLLIDTARWYLEAEIQCKKEESKEEWDMAYIDMKNMQDLLKEMQGENVDFSYINDSLELFNLQGLKHFIHHSDCDGRWDSSEAGEIYDFLKTTIKKCIPAYQKTEKQTLLDYIDVRNEEIFNNPDKYSAEELADSFYLAPVLKESMESGEDIYFC